ncbi:uncharacterized protein BO80DRAFT_147845 [Aspergillus ibericus CBS 121593]|uniref:Uncharacterized protein n=1 Tax=Aspergillus ibericus CBS 121593 TaxID=1448316 RepID=A0A395GV26_9EURO|nr:hypothetical protein BO80DRAFT_147845 [Aspergillus ibericus CBS 121593]RAK98868.1 hypothetical protein BO80DRAFT_147845 [Aspergillus ibericus CBS 121593]
MLRRGRVTREARGRSSDRCRAVEAWPKVPSPPDITWLASDNKENKTQNKMEEKFSASQSAESRWQLRWPDMFSLPWQYPRFTAIGGAPRCSLSYLSHSLLLILLELGCCDHSSPGELPRIFFLIPLVRRLVVTLSRLIQVFRLQHCDSLFLM